MSTFIVTVREVWKQMVSVKAKTKKEALELVRQRRGTNLDNTLMLSHDLDEEYWTVDKDES